MSDVSPNSPKKVTSHDHNSGSSSDDPSLNPSSSFFIHPSEGPTSVFITPALDGTNFHSWSRAIRMTLISKNKMAFLLGTIHVLDVTDPYYSGWERCNTLIMSWLLNSISPSIAQSVIFLESAVDI